MVEGEPLRYYESSEYQYFGRFDLHSDMSEELLMPHSPNSTQSDSENSVSSVEVSPKPPKHGVRTKSSIRCCWRSCGTVFDSLDLLASHVSKVHAASGPGGLFYCGWEGCTRNDRGFNARYKMLVHVRTHTNEKPHRCFQCDKSFSRAENLKIHTRSHSGEKPYVCPVVGCGKAYSNSSDRFKHTRTHQVDKPYQCKVHGCPKRYTDPSSLRKHVKTYKHFAGAGAPGSTEGGPGPCGCKRDCCVSTCLSRAAELLKLGGYIEMRGARDVGPWNSLLGPYIGEPREIFAPYVDIDGPLDLSVSRKQL